MLSGIMVKIFHTNRPAGSSFINSAASTERSKRSFAGSNLVQTQDQKNGVSPQQRSGDLRIFRSEHPNIFLSIFDDCGDEDTTSVRPCHSSYKKCENVNGKDQLGYQKLGEQGVFLDGEQAN